METSKLLTEADAMVVALDRNDCLDDIGRVPRLIADLAAALRSASPSPGAVEAAQVAFDRLTKAIHAICEEVCEGEGQMKGGTYVELIHAFSGLCTARRGAEGGRDATT